MQHFFFFMQIDANVRKCVNFLQTLIILTRRHNYQGNVKRLVQGLIDNEYDPEHFMLHIETTLQQNPQPFVIPFLRRTLPKVRRALANRKMKIDGVRAPTQL